MSEQTIGESEWLHASLERAGLHLLAGELDAAEAEYQQWIASGVMNKDVFHGMAAVCELGNRGEERAEYLARIVEMDPTDSEAQYNLGLSLLNLGEPDRAIHCFDAALLLNSAQPEIHLKRGNAYLFKSDFDSAAHSYQQALELKPDYAEACCNLGVSHRERGDLDAAMSCFLQALQIRATYPEAYANMGVTLLDLGHVAWAMDALNAAIELKNDFPQAHNALGVAYGQMGDHEAAVRSLRTAIHFHPASSEAHNNLGNALRNTGDDDGALSAYREAVRLSPANGEAHFNLALALLIRGDYSEGWQEYEWRSRRKADKASLPYARPGLPLWPDEQPDGNPRLLLVAEQGLGDTMQFIRYVPVLQSRGIQVSVCCQPMLTGLIQASGLDADPLTPEQANLVSDGAWLPLLSLPRILQVSPAQPIITEPYLAATDEAFQRWQAILSGQGRPLIGIHWQGNPQAEIASLRGRSLPLEQFAPLVAQTNGCFLSLQKGHGSEQLQHCSFRDRFVSCQEQVDAAWDFVETAAIIAHCDLVITSDSAVAHLAGGLGRPTWLLLHSTPDWRWGLEGDRSFWYPSMRLFRQQQRGDWTELMERVAEALARGCAGPEAS